MSAPAGCEPFAAARPVAGSAWTGLFWAPVKEQSRLSLGRDGRPRMTGNLKEGGIDAGHRRVGRLTRKNGIGAERTRKFKATTDSDHTFNIAPNPAWIVTSRRIGPTRTEGKRSDMGGRHQLHLALDHGPRTGGGHGLAPGPTLPARDRLGREPTAGNAIWRSGR